MPLPAGYALDTSAPTGPRLPPGYTLDSQDTTVPEGPVTRAVKGVARGLGVPTNREEFNALAAPPDTSKIFSNIAGPIPPAVAGYVANLQDAKHRIDTGDVAGGGAQGLTSLLPFFGGAVGEAGESEAGLPKVIGSNEQNFLQSSKGLVEAFQPTQAGKFQNETLRTAMPIIKSEAGGKTITRSVASDATDSAMAKNRAQYQTYLQRAEGAKAPMDGNQIADAMTAAIPEQLKLEKPAAYQRLKNEADVYRQTFTSPSQLANFLQTNNARLSGFYDKTNTGQNTAAVGNAKTAILQAQTDAYRKVLYGAMDPENGGALPAELQRRYGALKEFRGQLDSLNDRILRDPTLSLSQKAAGAVGQAYQAITDPKRAALNRLLQGVDTDKKFTQAFKNYNGKIPEVSTPGPYPNAPLNLNSPARPVPTFDWQRNLFPDQPERPVLPPPKQ